MRACSLKDVPLISWLHSAPLRLVASVRTSGFGKGSAPLGGSFTADSL